MDNLSNTVAAREARLRRKLGRYWYRLHKTPSRSWLRSYYGVGYMVTRDNTVQLGCVSREYEATLEQVEEWVEEKLGD